MDMLWESSIVLFSPTTENIDSDIQSYLVQVKGFQPTFSSLLIVRTGKKEKMHSKVGNCFHLKVPKLLNLANRIEKKSEIIPSSPSKKHCNKTKKIKPKLTKIT